MKSANQTIFERRSKISQYLAKGITKPQDLATNIGIDIMIVNNDLQWMRKHSDKWLSGWALNGYVFATKQTIEELEAIEAEMQAKRAQIVKNKPNDIETYLKIIHELKDVINMRWITQGEGPTLINLRRFKVEATK